MFFQSTGTLRYSPEMLGDRPPSWWTILDCDSDVGKYCRHLYHLATYRCKTLMRPSWAEHVTVIRGEEPPDKSFWEKYNGQKVDIQVEFPARTNGEYVWLPVTCEFLLDLREELGLPRQPFYPLHLSIGHCPTGITLDN